LPPQRHPAHPAAPGRLGLDGGRNDPAGGPGGLLPGPVAPSGEPGHAAGRPGRHHPRLERADARGRCRGVAAGAGRAGAHHHLGGSAGMVPDRSAGRGERPLPAGADVLGPAAAVSAVPGPDADRHHERGAPDRAGPAGRQRLSRPATLVLLASGCGAVALAHPQGVFGGLVLGVPFLLWATLVRARDLALRRPRATGAFLVTPALTAVVMAGSAMLWTRARPGRGSAVWEPNASLREAIGQTGSLSPN